MEAYFTQNTKNAVCTLCIGEEAKAFSTYSHPAFKAYSDKINADFVVIEKPRINFTKTKTINPVKFEKYQLFDILDQYERVLFVDTDILITPHAPNIFLEVPIEKIGGYYEDIAMNEANRRQIIQKIQDNLGDVGWKTGFLNSGVMVLSRQHRDIFHMIDQYGIYDDIYEQNNTNWYIHKAGFEIHPLHYNWNFMGFHRIIFGPVHQEAYFIHYAGGGIFGGIPRITQMQTDYEYFYGKRNNT